MSAVAQQHDQLDDNSLLCGRAFAFQHSRWTKGDEVSLAKCMEVPESCSAGVDERREMASTIKTEVLAELNATRKRLHQIASDFVGCNTLTSQVSSYRSTFRAKVKSHTSCRKQQQAENDVSMACAKFFQCDESQSNSPVREGKSDCRRRRSHANMHAFCQGNIGHVVGGHGRYVSSQHRVEKR